MKVSRICAALLAAFLWLCHPSGDVLPPEEDTAESVSEYVESQDIYALTGMVTRLDYESDTVEFTLANGLVFAFYGCEDYCLGDLVSALMWSAGSPTILDAVILDTRYAGTPEQFLEIGGR